MAKTTFISVEYSRITLQILGKPFYLITVICDWQDEKVKCNPITKYMMASQSFLASDLPISIYSIQNYGLWLLFKYHDADHFSPSSAKRLHGIYQGHL
jgi:hypothetical protein